MNTIFIGEHDKGYGTPFSPETYSGKVLRKLLSEVRLFNFKLDNAFLESGERRDLTQITNGYNVVALGRVAHKECIRQNIHARYLPHPAAFGKANRKKLAQGIHDLI